MFNLPRAAWIARASTAESKDHPADNFQINPCPSCRAVSCDPWRTWTRAQRRLFESVICWLNNRLVVNVKGGLISDALATGRIPR
jgi:hypothetical protein